MYLLKVCYCILIVLPHLYSCIIICENCLSFIVLAIFSSTLVIVTSSLSHLECRNFPDFVVNVKSIVVQMAFLSVHKNAK